MPDEKRNKSDENKMDLLGQYEMRGMTDPHSNIGVYSESDEAKADKLRDPKFIEEIWERKGNKKRYRRLMGESEE